MISSSRRCDNCKLTLIAVAEDPKLIKHEAPLLANHIVFGALPEECPICGKTMKV